MGGKGGPVANVIVVFFNPFIHKALLKEDSIHLNFNSNTILLNSSAICHLTITSILVIP